MHIREFDLDTERSLGRKHLYTVTDLSLFFQKMPEGSVVLLHACAHNPTGVDPKVTNNRILGFCPLAVCSNNASTL